MPVGGVGLPAKTGGSGGGVRRVSRSGASAKADEEALVPQGSSIADRIAAFNTLKGKTVR